MGLAWARVASMGSVSEPGHPSREPAAAVVAWCCAAGAMFFGAAWCHTFMARIEQPLEWGTFFWGGYWPQAGAAVGAAVQLGAGAALVFALAIQPRQVPLALMLAILGVLTSLACGWCVLSADLQVLSQFPKRPAHWDLAAEAAVAAAGPAFLAALAAYGCVRYWSTYRTARGRLVGGATGEAARRPLAAVTHAMSCTLLVTWVGYVSVHHAWSSVPSTRFDVGHLLRPVGVMLLATGAAVTAIALARRRSWLAAGSLASAAGATAVATSVVLLRAVGRNYTDTIMDLGRFFGHAAIGAAFPVFAAAVSAFGWWRTR